MAELPAMIRAFVALPIPAAVIERLSEIQDRLKLSFRDVSWTRPESMHLTLRFFGNVESARVEDIKDALAGATRNFQPFHLRLAGLGAFGNRVIWIGLAEGLEPLRKLELAIRAATKDFGVLEDREFNAHVTLGRFRKPGRGVAANLREIPRFDLSAWTATHIEFIRSELSPAGSRYTVLGTFPFSG